MPAEIVRGEFCASYYALYTVQGSRGATHTVTWVGLQGHCTCQAFKFALQDGKQCKHTRLVWSTGCFWNCQWHDGGPATLKPDEGSITEHTIPDSSCPNCGGPLVPVKIAV